MQPTQHQQQQQQQQQQQHTQPVQSGHMEQTVSPSCNARDYTKVPKDLDERYERLDRDNCLRPTILEVGSTWTKKEKKKLLANVTTRVLHSREQETERNAAFDLLDALTKSGGLPVEHASLHVLIAATHSFDKTVTDTVIQENVNPIEKVERSMLIMATTVHEQSAQALLNTPESTRIQTATPQLFLEDA